MPFNLVNYNILKYNKTETRDIHFINVRYFIATKRGLMKINHCQRGGTYPKRKCWEIQILQIGRIIGSEELGNDLLMEC